VATVADEFEQLYSLLVGYLSVEHKDDGTHSNITADSLTVAGDVTVSGSVTTSGNAFAVGEWAQMYLLDPTIGLFQHTLRRPGDVGSVNRQVGACVSNHYTMVGSTLFLTLEESPWGYTGTLAYVEIPLPVNPATGTRWKVKRRHRTYGYGSDNGVQTTIMAVGIADETCVRVYREDLVAWAISAANSSIFIQWHGEVY
jgi:hypothetical protein